MLQRSGERQLGRKALTLGCLSLWTLACTVYDPSLLEEASEDSSITSNSGGAGGPGGTGGSSGSGGSGGISTDSGNPVTSDSTTATSGGGSGGSGASGGGGGTGGSTSSSTTASTSDTGSSSGGSGGDSTTSSSSVTSTTTSNTSATSTSTNTTGSGGGSGSCDETDCCPDDPDKTEPGDCGCGELETDSDADDTADCIDLCPDDSNKTEPGECGCGILDADTTTAAGCVGIKTGLVHRFSFDGTGTTVADSVGSADGTVIGTTLDNSGALTLASGGAEQYAELPAGIVSALTHVTVEAWFSYSSTTNWQRVFDFGSTEEAAGEPGTGLTYLFFTPKSSYSGSYPRAVFTHDGFSSEVVCAGSSALATATMTHVALSIDTAGNTITLYINGMLQSAKAFPNALDTLDDTNNWLGRSQYQADGGFSGSIDELRIYDVALTSQQVSFSFTHGADPAFLD